MKAAGPALLAVVALTAAFTLPVSGQVVAGQQSPSAGQQEVIWHEVESLVPTRLYFPEDFDADESHVLVIALHGYGSSAQAFGRVGEQLAAAGFIVALPQPPYGFLVEGGLGFDWTLHHLDDDALSDRATLPLVERFLPSLAGEISGRYSIDGVYALGFSQGAVLAKATSIVNHEVFDGVVSFGLPDFRPGWFPGDAFAAGRGVDVLLVHGDADDRAPAAVSVAARDRLAAAGYDVALQRFAGGHSVPDEQLELVAQWIRSAGSLPVNGQQLIHSTPIEGETLE